MPASDRRPLIPARIAPMIVLACVGLAAPSRADDPGPDPDLPPANAAVVAFAREHLGEKVGDGQCTSLAREALRDAGMDGLRRGKDEADDYEWGEPVDEPADVLPGDVLQFRDAVFVSRRRVRVGRAVGISHETMTFPHHTAIVEEVRRGGKELVILHQNTGPANVPEADRQVVQRDTLKMSDLQPGGEIRAYRPKKERSTRSREAGRNDKESQTRHQ